MSNQKDVLRAAMDRAKRAYESSLKPDQIASTQAWTAMMVAQKAYVEYLDSIAEVCPELTCATVIVDRTHLEKSHDVTGYGWTADQIELLILMTQSYKSSNTGGYYRQVGHVAEGLTPLTLEVILNYDVMMVLYIARHLEKLFKWTRDGCTIDIHGGCFKAPQGANWKINIEFEDHPKSVEKCKLMCEYMESVGIKRETQTDSEASQTEKVGT